MKICVEAGVSYSSQEIPTEPDYLSFSLSIKVSPAIS